MINCHENDNNNSKELISKLFVRHTSGDKHWNEEKNSNDCLINLKKDNWMFEIGVKTRNQRKLINMQKTLFGGVDLDKFFITVKIYYFLIWPFVFLFICFRSCLHQVMSAKFMPPKIVCLQLQNLALITCFDVFVKYSIIFCSVLLELDNQLIFFLHSDDYS